MELTQQDKEKLIKKRIFWHRLQIAFDIILIIGIILFANYLFKNIEWLKQLNNPCQACMEKTNSTCINSDSPLFRSLKLDMSQINNMPLR
jgi:hypothetical protein